MAKALKKAQATNAVKATERRVQGNAGNMAVRADDLMKENLEKQIKVWDIVDGTRLANGRTFTSMELDGKAGFADGIRCDVDGNVWSSAGWVGDGYDGVHIFAPDGDRIGLIRLPEICSNVCFGGPKRNRLFMTASQSVYAVYVETQGAHIT